MTAPGTLRETLAEERSARAVVRVGSRPFRSP